LPATAELPILNKVKVRFFLDEATELQAASVAEAIDRILHLGVHADGQLLLGHRKSSLATFC